ncbi:hypothetical protein [Sciscionella sediminilitoris]|uniref:hypothetical protein n=1 Tax=Sciscionella sediminilitoris TaxID=1445613 RepID=UPI0004DF31FE|nr:hypothetical protein [Sciscionella sp. SE31]
MTSLAMSAALVLAGKQPGDQTGGNGPDFGKASPVALLVVLLLLIAVVFLVRSMTKHLRRAQRNLAGPEEKADGTGAEPGSSAESGSADNAAEPGETAESGKPESAHNGGG